MLKRVFRRTVRGRHDPALRTAAARAMAALVVDAHAARRVRRCRSYCMRWAHAQAARGGAPAADDAAAAARALLDKLDSAGTAAVNKQPYVRIGRLYSVCVIQQTALASCV